MTTEVGKDVVVETTDGQTIRGRIAMVSPASIAIVAPCGYFTIARAAIATVT